MIKEYENIEVFHGSAKTTSDLDMSKSQFKALEHAIHDIKDNDFMQGSVNIRDLRVTITSYGKIILLMQTDNGKPGTIGHIYYNQHQLFIGRKGGYSCIKDIKSRKRVRVNGWKALIYC